MKYLIIYLVLSILPGDLNNTALINRLKREAEKDFKEKNYSAASEKYRVLIDSLGQDDQEIKMNLSHCYFNLNDSSRANSQYKELTKSPSREYQSTAYQQLGILGTNSGRYQEAEENFKNALLANPQNEDARYNYELLKKKMKEQQQKDQKNQDKDKDQKNKQNQQQKEDKKQQDEQNKKQEEKDEQQKKDQQEKKNKEQNKESQDKKNEDQKNARQKEQLEKQKNEDEQKKLLNNNKNEVQKISQDKALMILEAMKNAEEQYLQQRQRKVNKKSDSGKPDW